MKRQFLTAFVLGKGPDGSHEFTRSLEEHNRAVQKFQLGK